MEEEFLKARRCYYHSLREILFTLQKFFKITTDRKLLQKYTKNLKTLVDTPHTISPQKVQKNS